MKTNWQTKKLEEICDIFADGDWIEKKDQSSKGLRLIQTGNIGNGLFKDRGEKARYISESTFRRLHCTEILPNDCLISRLPDPVGRSCIIPDIGVKMITAVDCTIVRFQKEILSQWFVYYSLSQEYQTQINKEISGATRQRISRNNLGSIEIPLPPLIEQKRIVKILDEVFEKTAKAKENAEKNLQNARDFFNSYLENIFNDKAEDWKNMKLELMCLKITDGSHNPPKGIEFSEYLMLSSKNIHNDSINLDSPRYLKKEDFESENKRTEITKGDVLLTIVGTIGRVAVVNEEHKFYTLQRSVAVLKPIKDIISSRFLMFSLRNIFDELTENARGVAQKGLYLNQIRSLKISIPKLSEQQVIVQKLDTISTETKKLEVIYQQKLKDLEELKKSILQKAFNGELVS